MADAGFQPHQTLSGVKSSKSMDEYLCWTKMQAEAGQALEAIVERKERERLCAGGLFFWGVGNSPAVIVSTLARMKRAVPVVFSVMKSKPKAVDLSPSKTVVWRKYIDADRIERSLPPSALVTSRGESASGTKKYHFALMCWSEVPLRLGRGKPFDPSAYRNAGGVGAPVGASQVTALLRRVSTVSAATDYEANLEAWLTGGYWVRLTDPLELTSDKLAAIADGPSAGQDWTDFVGELREGVSIAENNHSMQAQLI